MLDIVQRLIEALKDELLHSVSVSKPLPSGKTLELLEELGEKEFIEKLYKKLNM